MFFIFGSPRSGTTLLAQCLSGHPELAVPHETDFIVPMAFICDRIADLTVRSQVIKALILHSKGYQSSLGEYLTASELEPIIEREAAEPARLLEAIYGALAEKAGAKLAGDKSPNDLLFLRMLIKVGAIGPAAKIVHIVRDGRDVLSSILKANMTDSASRWFPRLWSSSNLYLRDLYEGQSGYLLVRYEEFVSEPERILAGVCAHLGVAFDDAMLDPSQRSTRYLGHVHHAELYRPISTRKIGAYRSHLLHDEVARCEAMAGEALARFGYI